MVESNQQRLDAAVSSKTAELLIPTRHSSPKLKWEVNFRQVGEVFLSKARVS